MKNKLRFMFILICFALIGLCEMSANAQGYGDRNRPAGRGTYRITGKVYLPDGSPAKDVNVSASGADFNNTASRTDLDGVFTLSGLPSGNYTVSVREDGYQTENEMLTIPEGTISGQAF
ncbi:MAG TPA: carboxypeptidase-like regulatory domain-containing protein, partial [Pyrinomonadaceae bacterium]|nr:carboxypeptidase-like regulatory domain-containing protein [Pyrinomonadaceae bacterium]